MKEHTGRHLMSMKKQLVLLLVMSQPEIYHQIFYVKHFELRVVIFFQIKSLSLVVCPTQMLEEIR